jgi:hypothetical protein
VNAALQRLRAELRFDREAFETRLRELESVDPASSDASAAQAAVALHHAYCAIESILMRVARQIEGSLPQGPDWHQALLHAAGLDLPGVRPAIFSRPTVDALRHLLGFRHFFRHGYAVPLDSAQLAALSREVRNVAPHLLAELDRLDAFLEQVASEAG